MHASRSIALIRALAARLPWLLALMMVSLGAAAPPVDSGEPVTQEDWVLSYALVIICVGLAVFVICRPGRRSQDIRRPL